MHLVPLQPPNQDTTPTRVHILAAIHHIETATESYDKDMYTSFELMPYLYELEKLKSKN